MSLEKAILEIIEQKMKDGTVEKMVEKQFIKGMDEAMNNLFRSYGDVTKRIEEKIKAVMVPYIESYDYSEYIVKLDEVMLEVLKNSAGPNKEILQNFNSLMIGEVEKETKLSDLFEVWLKFVEKHVSTDDLEVDYDDEPTYETVSCEMSIEYEEGRSWMSSERATVLFECEKDDDMNFALKLYRFKESNSEAWTIEYETLGDLPSLRHLSEFEVEILKLKQFGAKILIDAEDLTDEVRPEEMPEATFE